MLTCKCLNIVINNLSPDIQKVDYNSLQLSDTEKNDFFFQQELGRVNLGNITKEQASLVCARNVGNWIVHQCWNCGMFTHAIQKEKGASNVIINLKLLANDNEIKALRNSDRYSPAFHIVISHNENDLNNSGDISPQILPTENSVIGSLQQNLNEAIRSETKAAETRIRKYTEEQYNLLDEFTKRARTEYRILTRLVLAKQVSNCQQDSGIDGIHGTSDHYRLRNPSISSSTPPEMYNAPSSPISISKHANKPKNNTVNSLTSKLKRDSSRISSNKSSKATRSESYDSEGLFQLDGMEDTVPSQPLNQSDLESDTDDSQGGFDDQGSRNRSVPNNLAKSLPMNVPTFMSPYSRHAIDIDDDQAPEDPLDIAASIKALAKSVHGDAVFGDLPRPRFSSQI